MHAVLVSREAKQICGLYCCTQDIKTMVCEPFLLKIIWLSEVDWGKPILSYWYWSDQLKLFFLFGMAFFTSVKTWDTLESLYADLIGMAHAHTLLLSSFIKNVGTCCFYSSSFHNHVWVSSPITFAHCLFVRYQRSCTWKETFKKAIK